MSLPIILLNLTSSFSQRHSMSVILVGENAPNARAIPLLVTRLFQLQMAAIFRL